jgi:hypothetical protein
MRVGTTCVKKYGITQHISNSLLYVVLQKYITAEIEKEHVSVDDSYVFTNIETCLRTCIQEKYQEINAKIFTANSYDSPIIDYYDVVVPFRRLLTETCDLVMEYKFLSLKELLQEIENDIHLLDNNVKHRMIDEYEVSSASVSSDSSVLDTISEIDEEPTEEPAEEPTTTEEIKIKNILEDILQKVFLRTTASSSPISITGNIVIAPEIATTMHVDIVHPISNSSEYTQNIANSNNHIYIDEQIDTTTPYMPQSSSESIATLYTPPSPSFDTDWSCYCYGDKQSFICRCAVEYRLKILENNIQQFKKDVHAFSQNVKNTSMLYKTIYDTYKTISQSSSPESSSS